MSPPPVVLVHGLAAPASRTWVDTGWSDLLSEAGRDVVLVDLPGHGAAQHPGDPAVFGDLEGVVASTIGEGPVDAIGFSLGARVLLTLASSRPHLFRRLVVAGVGRNLFEPDEQRVRMIQDAVTGRPDPESPVAQHFAALAEDPEVSTDDLAVLLQQPVETLDPATLATVTVPVLVVLGEHDFAGPADPLVEALPNVELVALRGVDHFATPKSFAFIDSALEFLDARPF